MTSLRLTESSRKRVNQLPGIIETIARHDKEINKINTFLFTGNVDANEPSLSERIRNIEKNMERLASTGSRVLWVIATYLIVTLLERALDFMK